MAYAMQGPIMTAASPNSSAGGDIFSEIVATRTLLLHQFRCSEQLSERMLDPRTVCFCRAVHEAGAPTVLGQCCHELPSDQPQCRLELGRFTLTVRSRSSSPRSEERLCSARPGGRARQRPLLWPVVLGAAFLRWYSKPLLFLMPGEAGGILISHSWVHQVRDEDEPAHQAQDYTIITSKNLKSR